jgi:hypothetical protein
MNRKKKLSTFNELCWNLAEKNNFEMTKIYRDVDKYFYLNNCKKLKTIEESDIEFERIYSFAKDSLLDLKSGNYSKRVIDYINEYVAFCRTTKVIIRKSQAKQSEPRKKDSLICKSCGKKFSDEEIMNIKSGRQFRCECNQVIAFNPAFQEIKTIHKIKSLNYDEIIKANEFSFPKEDKISILDIDIDDDITDDNTDSNEENTYEITNSDISTIDIE